MATTNVADLNLDADESAETITPGSSRAVSTFVGEATPDIQGEITQSDLRLPRLNVGQKMGDLGDQFGNGSIIIAKEFSIAKVNEIVSGVTVAKIRKQYQEKLKFDPTRTAPPVVFNTAKEVQDAGMSVNFGDDGYCERVAHMLLVIPAVDGLEEEELDSFFYHSFEGKRYGAVLYTAASSQFTEAGKTVLTAASKPDCITHSLRLAKWDISGLGKSGKMGNWWVLKFARTGNNTPAFIEFTKTIQP